MPAPPGLSSDAPEAPTGPGILEQVSDELTNLGEALGGRGEDYRLAKRVLSKQRRKPNLTVPEVIVEDYLEQMGVPFISQPPVHGGRGRLGGLHPDVVIPKGGWGIAVMIQGDWFHSPQFQNKFNANQGGAGRDVMATIKMKGQYVGGVRIESVVQVFEGDLMNRSSRSSVLVLMIAGQSFRHQV
jgi:hypothetical protein